MAYYGTVEQFFTLLSPPDALWPTGRLRLSQIPTATKDSGTGTGTVRVRGNAHGTYSVRVRCATAGEVNSSAGVNPGALPTFEISLDGGTTYTGPYRVSDSDDVAVLNDEITGLQCGLIFEFRGDFDALDLWSTSAEPSPDVVLFLQTAASLLNGKLSNTLRQPLTAAPLVVIYVQGALALWAMIRKCGLDGGQDFKSYSPSEPREELAGLSVSQQIRSWIQGEDLGVFDAGDDAAKLFPRIVTPTCPMAPYLPL